MTNFTYPTNCGNSPKLLRVIEIMDRYIKGMPIDFESYFEPTCIIEVSKEITFGGIEQIRERASKFNSKLSSVEFIDLLSHGNLVSVFGKLELNDLTYEFGLLARYKGHKSGSKLSFVKLYLVK